MTQGNSAVLARADQAGLGLVQPRHGLNMLQQVLVGCTYGRRVQVCSVTSILPQQAGLMPMAVTSVLLESSVQEIASPFAFDRLLHGLHPTPYVFSHIASDVDLRARHVASRQKLQPFEAVNSAPKPLVTSADVIADVCALVHTILGPQVQNRAAGMRTASDGPCKANVCAYMAVYRFLSPSRFWMLVLIL
jgi:hypothetical protein